ASEMLSSSMQKAWRSALRSGTPHLMPPIAALLCWQPEELGMALVSTEPELRRIVFRTKGHQHGPITRLVSPSDIGELIKPFVFLDRARVPHAGKPMFGIHPHSGIATVTVVLDGSMWYEDTTGKKGQIQAGGLEWMKAGAGVWHEGGALPGAVLRVFQLWI